MKNLKKGQSLLYTLKRLPLNMKLYNVMYCLNTDQRYTKRPLCSGHQPIAAFKALVLYLTAIDIGQRPVHPMNITWKYPGSAPEPIRK